MTEKELRQNVVDIAVAWLGLKESDGSHKTIIDLYNNHKPLAQGYKVSYTDAWCATFVSAVAIKAGLTDIIPTECSCVRQINLFKQLGEWQESDAYTPSAGDVIYYDWDDSGVGDNTGTADHVGIVVSCTGGTIKVIEGNKNDSVAYRSISVNGKYIRGFGLPDYASKATSSSSSSNSSSSSSSSSSSTSKVYYKHTVVSGDTLSKIASTYDTTVNELVSINGITNPNVIKVGQVIYLSEAAAALGKLEELGVIDSPEYWLQAIASDKVKYLETLIIRAAESITKKGTRASTVEAGIAALVSAGVINTPSYWQSNYKNYPYLDSLLKALGGAV